MQSYWKGLNKIITNLVIRCKSSQILVSCILTNGNQLLMSNCNCVWLLRVLRPRKKRKEISCSQLYLRTQSMSGRKASRSRAAWPWVWSLIARLSLLATVLISTYLYIHSCLYTTTYYIGGGPFAFRGPGRPPALSGSALDEECCRVNAGGR